MMRLHSNPLPRAAFATAEPAIRMGAGGNGSGPGDSEQSRKAEAPQPGRLRVGVVEDEAIIALEIEETLLALGAEVVGTALSAEEAVKLAEAERPDCMTMDVRLKGERDGVSAAIEIFERFGIRSIFISAFDRPPADALAAPDYMLGWLAKPLRQNELDAALAQLRRDG